MGTVVLSLSNTEDSWEPAPGMVEGSFTTGENTTISTRTFKTTTLEDTQKLPDILGITVQRNIVEQFVGVLSNSVPFESVHVQRTLYPLDKKGFRKTFKTEERKGQEIYSTQRATYLLKISQTEEGKSLTFGRTRILLRSDIPYSSELVEVGPRDMPMN